MYIQDSYFAVSWVNYGISNTVGLVLQHQGVISHSVHPCVPQLFKHWAPNKISYCRHQFEILFVSNFTTVCSSWLLSLVQLIAWHQTFHLFSSIKLIAKLLPLQWYHMSVMESNHWQLNCVFNSLVNLTTKKRWKHCTSGPLWGEFTKDLWGKFTEDRIHLGLMDSPHKGTLMHKAFHVITSSWQGWVFLWLLTWTLPIPLFMRYCLYSQMTARFCPFVVPPL